jgi:hypothetical protein
MAGGFSFRDDDGEQIYRRELDDDDNPVATFIGDAFSNFDGLSRRDRVRYDTPKFFGFYGSTSYMNGQTYDFALRSAHKWDGFGKLAAAIGYVPGETKRDAYTLVSGSVSFLHDSGLNLTFSHGMKDFDGGGRNTARNYYGKLGYICGKWAFSVDGARSDKVQQNGDEATSIGLAAVWNIWESVQFYGGYRWHGLDRDNEFVDPETDIAQDDPEDINSVMIGGRIKF